MEININNAFYQAFKFSIRPCFPVYVVIADSIQKAGHKIVSNLLQAPLCTTLIAYFVLISLTFILTISCLTYIGLIGVIFSIIMFEGISIVALTFISFQISFVIIFVILIMSCF